jgi:hypothetical protein
VLKISASVNEQIVRPVFLLSIFFVILQIAVDGELAKSFMI